MFVKNKQWLQVFLMFSDIFNVFTVLAEDYHFVSAPHCDFIHFIISFSCLREVDNYTTRPNYMLLYFLEFACHIESLALL